MYKIGGSKMNAYLYVIFLGVSFCASVVGAICGIGGGVLIKPLLDAFGILSVASISFLSGCTVLSMSCYSVVKAKKSGDSLVDMKTGTPLAEVDIIYLREQGMNPCTPVILTGHGAVAGFEISTGTVQAGKDVIMTYTLN